MKLNLLVWKKQKKLMRKKKQKTKQTHRPKPRPATRDHLQKKRKPFQDVFILLEPELEHATNKAEAEVERLTGLVDRQQRLIDIETLEAARLEGNDKVQKEAELEVDAARLAELEEELAAAETAYEEADTAQIEATIAARVESIGRKPYDALVDDYPPTEEQIAEWQKDNPKEDGTPGDSLPDYDGDKFPPALIAACLVGELKGLTPDEVDEWTSEWNFAEFMQLFTAAIAVNAASRVQPWGKDYG